MEEEGAEFLEEGLDVRDVFDPTAHELSHHRAHSLRLQTVLHHGILDGLYGRQVWLLSEQTRVRISLVGHQEGLEVFESMSKVVIIWVAAVVVAAVVASLILALVDAHRAALHDADQRKDVSHFLRGQRMVKLEVYLLYCRQSTRCRR